MVDMKKYTHISHREREMIFLYLNQGKSFREIGKILERNHTSIKREVKRNSKGKGGEIGPEVLAYLPLPATELSVERRISSRKRKLDDESIRHFVIGKLSRGWSPEQISGRLKLEAPNCAVSHEIIYQFIYDKKSRSERLWEFLRKGRKRRQTLFSRKSQCLKRLRIPNKVPIEQRPEEATLRSETGHLESDLLEGIRNTKEAISVLVDRKTRYVAMDKLPNKESEGRTETLIKRIKNIPLFPRTITLDNGSENFCHERIIKEIGCQTYFCNPYHSWEKGTVENTIGLVRSYIPKGTDLRYITTVDLNTISWELNNRPRKTLGFYTPLEVLYNQTDTGALQV